MTQYDVLTFGESMMRLTPPGFLRIEQTRSFDIWVGGTESNTAVGLARLGMKAAWLSACRRRRWVATSAIASANTALM